MTILLIIFSYNRRDDLIETINTAGYTPREDEDIEVVILDDGSDYTLDDVTGFVKLKHTGKKGFYQKWADAFYLIKQAQPDMIVFMPDDFKGADVNKMVELHKAHRQAPYCFNIINDGRDICWTGVKPGEERDYNGFKYKQIGFVDCGFFCNLAVIDLLEYTMFKTSDSWFDREGKSSGVGYQLSKRLKSLGVRMFKPIQSLAHHGDHDSVMHPEHRKEVKLISK